MAGTKLNRAYQRRKVINLSANVLKQVDFDSVNNLFPTVFQLFNYGTTTVLVGEEGNLTTAANYMLQTAGGGVSVFANPQTYTKLFLLSTGDAKVIINTWVTDEVDMTQLYQTQATTIINSTVTSSVNISSALPAGTNNIGDVDIAGALPAGDNNIGNVDIASALPVGDNNIGNVDIASALPTGANVIGGVTIADGSAATFGAKADAAVTNPASTASVVALLKGLLTGVNAATPAGTNNIGDVDVLTMPDVSTAVPTIYNVTCTNANQEYTQAFTNAKKIILSIQDGTSTDNFRLAFVTGKVATPTAPFIKYPASMEFALDGMNIASGTLYFASSVAGKVMQIMVW